MEDMKDECFTGYDIEIVEINNEKIYSFGYYENGLKEGDWTTYYDENRLNVKAIIIYINGKKEGISEEYDESGNLIMLYFYQNEEKNEVIDNVEYYYYDIVINKYDITGDKNVGKYVNLKKEGIWKCYLKDGRVQETKYRNGEKVGDILIYYDNKLLNGLFRSYDIDLSDDKKCMSYLNYKDGKLDGLCK
jgi:antitoxin component YwqK of YwqJK toxin-antitoxin module